MNTGFDMDNVQRHIEASRGTLIEKYGQLQIDYRNARADVDALAARVAALEQLLIEYHDFVSVVLDAAVNPTKAAHFAQLAMLNDMQQRARTLLHEGQTDTAKEETR